MKLILSMIAIALAGLMPAPAAAQFAQVWIGPPTELKCNIPSLGLDKLTPQLYICGLNPQHVAQWQPVTAGSGLSGTPGQVTVTGSQLGVDSPFTPPGPVIIPGVSAINMIPQLVCLGPPGSDQISVWNDGTRDWLMFYDGTSNDCQALLMVKVQANGYTDGQTFVWCQACNDGRGGFEPPPTTRGLSYNTTLGYYVSKRGTAGCTTAASIGGVCASPIVVTWPTPLPNTNYSVTCSGMTPTNVPTNPYVVSSGKTTTTVTVNYFAITAAAASFATVDCNAVLD